MRIRPKVGLVFVLFTLYCVNVGAAGENASSSVDKITYWYRNFDSLATYELLKLTLDKTVDFYGPYEIAKGPALSQGRALAALMQGHDDINEVMNVVVDDERAELLTAISLPTDKGYIGYRICIINQDDAPRFDGVRSHSDLIERGVLFGQGSHWPDTRILQDNKLPVVTSVRYERLFHMLKGGRFNCYLRGANEVVDDLKRNGDDDLMIEPSLAFVYPSTSLFFVGKHNTELAARIELGLRRAKLDGSFDQYFADVYSSSFNQLRMSQRRVIRLNNPLISDEVLLNKIDPIRFESFSSVH